MRIITQRCDKSIEFDGTEINIQTESIIFQSGISKGMLGRYESEYRAIEVFDEMHNQWRENPLAVYYMPET